MKQESQPIKKTTKEGVAPVWEARKPFLFEKDFFQLQYDFAKELKLKWEGTFREDSLLKIIDSYTSELRFGALAYEKHTLIGLKDGGTEEGIVDFAYTQYLKKEENEKPAEYHPENSSRFGCFYYGQALQKEQEGIMGIHFFNAEFDSVSPLDATKREMRKKEIHDVLVDIKEKYPHVTEMTGTSWMLGIPSFQKMFPKSFLDNTKIDERRLQWFRGSTIWGQFIDNQYKLKKDLANELMKRVRELPKDAPLADIFKKGPPLLPPLETHGPIKDFYEMYGIK